MRTKINKICAWFRRYPLMISVCYLLFYLAAFHWLEETVVPRYIIHCKLDELIPFCEAFIIPYICWFPYIGGMFLWFYRRGWDDYKKLCQMIFSGLTICLIIYYIFPTGLNLRLASSPHETGALYNLVVMLRAIDTPTNVCPSIHVMNTVMCFQAVCSLDGLKHRRATIAAHLVIMVLICASTVLLDQHSIIDVVCGAMMSFVIHGLVYKVEWKNELATRKSYAEDRSKKPQKTRKKLS
ncbi:MAG: phosphatase PAP2 family protein [Lachnospiraceae bacterium]|nr:phosphatase PAP2 family protein [Lachnospiraceae bacterium]